jgi:hypothetical protein
MYEVNRDTVHAQSLQTRIQGLPEMFRRTIAKSTGTVRTGCPADAELGRYNDLIPAGAERLREIDLGLPQAIDIGGVEKVDAGVEGLLNSPATVF